MITKLTVDNEIPLIGELRLGARLSVSQPTWDTTVASVFNKSSNIKIRDEKSRKLY